MTLAEVALPFLVVTDALVGHILDRCALAWDKARHSVDTAAARVLTAPKLAVKTLSLVQGTRKREDEGAQLVFVVRWEDLGGMGRYVRIDERNGVVCQFLPVEDVSHVKILVHDVDCKIEKEKARNRPQLPGWVVTTWHSKEAWLFAGPESRDDGTLCLACMCSHRMMVEEEGAGLDDKGWEGAATLRCYGCLCHFHAKCDERVALRSGDGLTGLTGGRAIDHGDGVAFLCALCSAARLGAMGAPA